MEEEGEGDRSSREAQRSERRGEKRTMQGVLLHNIAACDKKYYSSLLLVKSGAKCGCLYKTGAPCQGTFISAEETHGNCQTRRS